MAEEKKVIDAHVDENGKVVEEKKKFSLKAAWAKVPGWVKKTMKVVGVLGLAAGAYAAGRQGRDSSDPGEVPLLDVAADNDNSETGEF